MAIKTSSSTGPPRGTLKARELFLLLAEWNRQDLEYGDRINHLRNGGGLNGNVLLNAGTVAHDNSVDVLIGSSGLDWFWDNIDANGLPLDSINGQNGMK